MLKYGVHMLCTYTHIEPFYDNRIKCQFLYGNFDLMIYETCHETIFKRRVFGNNRPFIRKTGERNDKYYF